MTFIDKLPTDQHQEKMTDDVEQMSDVELSSDSEAENIENEDGVSLVIFKRPPLKTRTVEEVEVRDLLPFSRRIDLNPTLSIKLIYIDFRSSLQVRETQKGSRGTFPPGTGRELSRNI